MFEEPEEIVDMLVEKCHAHEDHVLRGVDLRKKLYVNRFNQPHYVDHLNDVGGMIETLVMNETVSLLIYV